MDHKKVLVTATNYSDFCMDAKRFLEAAGVEVIENPHDRPFTQEELLEIIGGIDGVVVGVDSWNDAVFDHAPRLKALARFGVGVDNIDLEAAKRHGIVVSNARGLNSNSVAELAAGLILSCLRNIPNFNASTRAGKWDRFMGHDLYGMTVGLLGFGDIAQKLAKKLGGFEVNLIAYDLYPNTEKAKELGVTFCSMDEVLSRSDIVSLHLPSLEETRHIMDDEAFDKMKPGACFVNTARGMLVDETALFRALQSGRLFAAASDVYEQEPVSTENPLFTLENFFATPHRAADTYATYRQVGMETARALLEVFEGREPKNRLV